MMIGKGTALVHSFLASVLPITTIIVFNMVPMMG